MPRLPQTERDRQCSAVKRAIDAYKAERYRAKARPEEVAKALGVPYPRLQRLLRESPEKLELRELQSIANALNITVPTLLGYRDTRYE